MTNKQDQAIRRWAKRHKIEVDTTTLSPFAYTIHCKSRAAYKSFHKLCVRNGLEFGQIDNTVFAIIILPHFVGGDGASYELPCYDGSQANPEDNVPF